MASRSHAPARPAPRDKSAAAFENLRSKIAGLKLKPVKEPRRRRLPGEPDLTPLFPIVYLTPKSKCPHKGPLRRGTQFVCMVCYRSGLDHLPALARRPATDPKPEGKPPPKAERKLTRKEIRALRREWQPRAAELAPEELGYLAAQGVVLKQGTSP